MKKGHRPITKVKNPEPNSMSPDWVVWAAWADRITFEEIKKRSGYSESDVIKIMRKKLKPSSFRLWRKRAKNQSIKHRKKFELSRKEIMRKIKKRGYKKIFISKIPSRGAGLAINDRLLRASK